MTTPTTCALCGQPAEEIDLDLFKAVACPCVELDQAAIGVGFVLLPAERPEPAPAARPLRPIR